VGARKVNAWKSPMVKRYQFKKQEEKGNEVESCESHELVLLRLGAAVLRSRKGCKKNGKEGGNHDLQPGSVERELGLAHIDNVEMLGGPAT